MKKSLFTVQSPTAAPDRNKKNEKCGIESYSARNASLSNEHQLLTVDKSLNLITSHKAGNLIGRWVYFSFFAAAAARLRLSAKYMIQKNPMILLVKTRSIGGTKLKFRNTGRVR
jgi:hypothetical protein